MRTTVQQQIGLALLRIVPSLMMMTHGFPKLQKLLSGDFAFADPIGIGQGPSLFLTVIGEFVAPLLIVLGFKTRFATVPAIITMLVAAFVVHGEDPFGKKELALIYATIFIVIGLLGPGRYSVDGK